MRFTDFLQLNEDIFVKGDELLAAVNTGGKPRPSTKTSIATNIRPLGRQAASTRGDEVFYAFRYVPGDGPGETTEILKSLKGKGPFSFSERRRSAFLDDATSHIAGQFRKMNRRPDVIVTPQSSSALTADFANTLADKLKVDARKIGAFKKTVSADLPDDRKEAKAYIIKKYIDTEYFDEKFKGDEDARAKALAVIAYQILKSIKDHGHIVAKDLYKPYLKFVKNIVTSDLDDEYSLMDKEVMVVDDVLASGGTMSDLFRACKTLGAKSIYGCTLFARTSTAEK